MGRRCRPTNRFTRLISFTSSSSRSNKDSKKKESVVVGETPDSHHHRRHLHQHDELDNSVSSYDECLITSSSTRFDSDRSASDSCLAAFIGPHEHHPQRNHVDGDGGHRRSKSVRFGQCNVRRYSQVMGNHPCCSIGCPLELGWDYQQGECLDVDTYEACHRSSYYQKSSEELRLTYEERLQILQDKYTDGEVRRACRKLNRERCRNHKRGMNAFFTAPVPPPPTSGEEEPASSRATSEVV